MERIVGTVVRGLRAPIVKNGDDLRKIVVDTVMQAAENGEFVIRDRDILAVTESIVARAQNNYCSVDDIAEDVRTKLGGETIGIVFPITSRNRFSIVLRGFAKGAKKVVVQLSYPSDEVGNHIVSEDMLEEKGVDPYKDVLTEEQFVALFGRPKHQFTGMDYVSYYRQVIEDAGAEAEIVFSNDPRTILQYTKKVLTCDIHTRARSKRLLLAAGAETVCGMDDIMNAPINGSGYNDRYGLLGSNKATEDTVKLFPVICQEFVEDVQA